MDILSAALRYRMFEPGDRVVVAVSGGPDSMAMLHALHARSGEFGILPHVAHINHGLRGEESNLDEDLVRTVAQSYGLPVTVHRVDVTTYRRRTGQGEEEAARDLRYNFLQQTAADICAAKVAVGHTADDRAESVLLNLIRGAGVHGLGSIRPVRGNVVRPLIDAWRSEIEDYLEQNAVAFRIDESNADLRYTRNRVRHELIPLLGSGYNRQVRAALVRISEIAADQTDLMDALAEQATSAIRFKGALDAEMLLDLPKALRSWVVRSEISQQKGDMRDVSLEQTERVLKALESGANFRITLPSGLIYAARRGDAFRVERKRQAAAAQFDYPLSVPGSTAVPEAGILIQAEVCAGRSAEPLPPDEALIDQKSVVGRLRVRNARPGDSIAPFGMTGHKKLQDIFVDSKVPRDQRARSAVIVDDEKILWVAGIVASERGRVTGTTRRVIHLRAVPYQ